MTLCRFKLLESWKGPRPGRGGAAGLSCGHTAAKGWPTRAEDSHWEEEWESSTEHSAASPHVSSGGDAPHSSPFAPSNSWGRDESIRKSVCVCSGAQEELCFRALWYGIQQRRLSVYYRYLGVLEQTETVVIHDQNAVDRCQCFRVNIKKDHENSQYKKLLQNQKSCTKLQVLLRRDEAEHELDGRQVSCLVLMLCTSTNTDYPSSCLFSCILLEISCSTLDLCSQTEIRKCHVFFLWCQ